MRISVLFGVCLKGLNAPSLLSARIGRTTLGRELATVHDYRQRLNQYRTDPGLIAAHEKGPWITVWVNGFEAFNRLTTTYVFLHYRTTMKLPTNLGKLVPLTAMILLSAAAFLLPVPALLIASWLVYGRITNGCLFVKSPRTTN